VAHNIISTIDGNESKKMKFNYKTKGMMADIGKRSGVAIILSGYDMGNDREELLPTLLHQRCYRLRDYRLDICAACGKKFIFHLYY